MSNIDDVIKETSSRTGIDIHIVDTICKHVFRFTINVMKDPCDYHEVLFSKLFKFKLKPRFSVDKTKTYSPKVQ